MKNSKVCIVISQFNKEISENLLEGAIDSFTKSGGLKENIIIHKVPGAFEIPGLIKKILNNSPVTFDSIISLGSIIKGDTAHFDYISETVTKAIMDINIDDSTSIPILYGILTTFNYEQALTRSKVSEKNKGGEVMQAAIDTMIVYKKI